MFDELGDGVFRRRYESLDLNIGVVIGEAGVLLVDSRASHRQADELINELQTLTSLPVVWLVNSHFHWDHTWGNARFPTAAIWGHDLCRTEMLEQGEEARQGVLEWMPVEHHEAVKEVVITPPDNTFASTTQIALGNRIVDLGYFGRGHTNSDIVARVGDAGVLFAGDLVEQGAPPSFGDAYPLEWATTLEAIELETTVVPGHGDLVDADFVVTQRAEIASIVATAVAGHQGGAPQESLIDRGPYPETTMKVAIERAYAQLDGDI